MTSFEEIGVNRQIEAATTEEAEIMFECSCRACCRGGFKIECDRCCIASVHKDTMDFLKGYPTVKA